MKKILMALIVLFFVFSQTFSEEFLLFRQEVYKTYDWLNGYNIDDIALKYDSDYDIFYLCHLNDGKMVWVDFTYEDVETLRNTFIKFKEWQNIAEKNNINIEKEVPNSQITTGIYWEIMDESFFSDGLKIQFEAVFDEGENFIAISSNTVYDDNGWASVDFDDYIISEEQIEEFFTKISKESLKKLVEDCLEKEQQSKLFN